MRYLITQTLLSSWNYLFSCQDSCKEDAYNDFLDTLNRVPKRPTQEMQNGIEFENEVYKESLGQTRDSHPQWEKGIKAVASVIAGAPTQVKVSRELCIGDMTFLVYGILDVLKAGTIYDVKFSNKSFHSAELAGKYLDSQQHPTYFYLVPEASKFTYLVSDGDDLYTETYTPENTRPLADIIYDFIISIDALGLLGLYKEKWVAL